MVLSPYSLITKAASLAVLFVLSIITGHCSSLPVPVVTGQVKDNTNRAVKGSDVILTDKKSGEAERKRTNRKGRFKIAHEKCHLMTLEVIPPVQSDLARAFIDNVPGDNKRSYVIHLRSGFVVSGRITHGGRGVQNVTVKFIPGKAGAADRDSSDNVHGTGVCQTGREGEFACILTPGKKRLVVLNDVYSDLSPRYEMEVTITSKYDLPAIEIPSAQK